MTAKQRFNLVNFNVLLAAVAMFVVANAWADPPTGEPCSVAYLYVCQEPCEQFTEDTFACCNTSPENQCCARTCIKERCDGLAWCDEPLATHYTSGAPHNAPWYCSSNGTCQYPA